MSNSSLGSRSASTCYYPNGDISSDGDIPCDSSGDSVPCCPLNWSCQDNGLCYLANEQYLGRYTCTDPNWGNGCPEICTYDNSASGNEAVLECSTNSYCCDTNRPDLTNPDKACCKTSNSRFSLDDRKSMLPQGSSPSSTGAAAAASSNTGAAASSNSGAAASSNSGAAAASSTTEASIQSSSNSPSPSSVSSFSSSTPSSGVVLKSLSLNGPSSNTNSPSVTVFTSVVSEHATPVSTIISTSPVSAAPAVTTNPSPISQNGSGSKHLGAIIGPAIAVPLALAAIALAFFLFWRRRRRPQAQDSTYPSGYSFEPKYEGALAPSSPYSIVNKSELEGSSPNLSSSPATAQTGFSRFESPKIQSNGLSPDPSSAGNRGSSGLSQMSAVDQPQIFEVPAGPV